MKIRKTFEAMVKDMAFKELELAIAILQEELCKRTKVVKS